MAKQSAAATKTTKAKKTTTKPDEGLDERNFGSLSLSQVRQNPNYKLLNIAPRIGYISASGMPYWSADSQYWNMLDEMYECDTVINDCVNKLCESLLKAELTVTAPAGFEKDTKALEILEAVNTQIIGNKTERGFSHLRSIACAFALRHGCAHVEVIWENVNGAFVPVEYRQALPTTFSYDYEGNLLFAKTRLPVEKYKYLDFRILGDYENPYGTPVTWSLRYAYDTKRQVIALDLDAMQFSSAPIIAPEQSNQAKGQINKEELARALTQKGGTIVVLPPETRLNVHEFQSGAGTSRAMGTIEYWDEQIRVDLLGATLASVAGENGARSLGEVHERTIHDRAMSYAGYIDSGFQTLVNWFVEINFGTESLALAPRVLTHTASENDIDILLKRLEAGANYLGEYSDVPVDWLRKGLGLPTPGDDDDSVELAKKNTLNTSPTDGNTEEPAEAEEDKEEEFTISAHTHTDADGMKECYACDESEMKRKVESARAQCDKVGTLAFSESLRWLAASVLSAVENIALEAHIKDNAASITASIEKNIRAQDWTTNAGAMVAISFLMAYRDAAEVVTTIREKNTKKGAKNAFSRLLQFAKPTRGKTLQSLFKAVATWFEEREVMTVPQVIAMSKMIANNLPNMDEMETERKLRLQIEALAGEQTIRGIETAKSIIAGAIDNDVTVGYFLEDIGEALRDGTIPESELAYWRTVYTTETGNAERECREMQESENDFDAVLWGWEGHCMHLPKSRPGHKRITGVRWRKGSKAAQHIKGGPPWDYNCRCSLIQLVSVDPDNPPEGYEESSNALEVARGIERFER